MNTWSHTTVLLNEAVDALLADTHPDDATYVDGTFGRGGHSRLILSRLEPGGRLVAFDKDPQAIEAAAQTLYGAAKMVLETGKHPAELRDQVTSPGGTTIAGIYAMEKRGIRAALIDGVKACLDRSDEMSGK